ncbi:MAG: excinuclease ABC subunit UvrC [Terriglobia bacterium]
MNPSLAQKAESLPAQPGVYLFRDAQERPIYVGKAGSLRQRVRSYFQDSRSQDVKRDAMLEAAEDLEWIVVDSDAEAFVLENNLIKQFKPRYNVLLRDDKTYPYVKLTVAERFPRVYVTRRLKKDGSLYFGPYFPPSLAYRLIDLIHRTFLIPSCYVDLARFHPRPCLQYYIKRCLGPCVEGLTSPDIYSARIRQVRMLLEGRVSELSRDLYRQMAEVSEAQRYEEAARLRDQIRVVEEIRERQKMGSVHGEDTDIFGFHQEGPLVAVNVFHLRGGRVVDRREFFWEDQEVFDPPEFFSSLLKQLYLDQQYLPAVIHVPVDFEDRDVLAQFLSGKSGARVRILTPQGGPKRSMLELVAKNARHSFDRRFKIVKPALREMLDNLVQALDLPRQPKRIEAFDISHIQGTDVVGSMVVWENGAMKKSDYRKFILKSVPRNDDFASMREVVTRRYRRLLGENKRFPDLILIDGGIGQLHAAAEALESLQVINQPMAAIAKREEILYAPGRENEPIALDHHSPALHLIQQIRDEAHRFAVTFHRSRRSHRQLTTELIKIPGIGEKTAQKLLSHFGSLEAIRNLSIEELGQIVKAEQAEAIHRYLTTTDAAETMINRPAV